MPKSGLDSVPGRITVCTVRMTRAIFFSLLLVWVQMVAAVEPRAAHAQEKACVCPPSCKTRCCVSESAPTAPASAPMAPVRAGAQNQFSIPPAVPALWILPDARTVSFSSASSSPLTAAGAPLYERNCALLL